MGNILKTAERIVNGERQNNYGPPERNLELIADLWSVYLKNRLTTEIKLDPDDVAMMMILLKIGREAGGDGSIDNLVDIAGYAYLASIVK